MAWDGYFEYAGNEFINVARTEAYVKNARIGWFRPHFKNEALPLFLGETYRTPLLDDAPWTDPDVSESFDFYGVFPLGIDGLENSTRTSTVVESLGVGGLAGLLRHTTKTVVFNAVLVAGTEAAAEYGMRWLRKALLGDACGPSTGSSCFGADLCYLASRPEVDALGLAGNTPDECMDPYRRSLRKVVFNNGPTLTGKRETVDGGAVWQVTFTAVAGSPYEVGAEVPVIEGLLDPEIEVPWANGVEPVGGAIDLDGYMADDSDCTPPVFAPVVDPLFPAIITPPGPPSVPLGNFRPPASWRRRQFTIPKQYVPLWGEVVPKITVHARHADLRNLRLRFYDDPFLTGDISDDPCAYCGDIIFSYLPQHHSLVFDASEERVYVRSAGGGEQRGDSLVFKSDGTPFDWPVLSCGFGYVVTLDLPSTQKPPVVDLSLYARAV